MNDTKKQFIGRLQQYQEIYNYTVTSRQQQHRKVHHNISDKQHCHVTPNMPHMRYYQPLASKCHGHSVYQIWNIDFDKHTKGSARNEVHFESKLGVSGANMGQIWLVSDLTKKTTKTLCL